MWVSFKIFLGRLFLAILLSDLLLALVQEAADGSVCVNNCSGHGTCIDYSCHCLPGYSGDDCSVSFLEEGQKVVPILTAGHFNLTSKNFSSTIAKNKFILVGFSAYSCHKCITVEPEYEKLAEALKEKDIPFARANLDAMKSLAREFETSELPALILFHKQRPLPYRGVQSVEAVMTYVEKQTSSKAAVTLKSVEEVEAFIESRNSSKYSISTVMVVGFFSQHQDVEEDEYEEFLEVAKEMKSKEDVYFGVVTSPSVSAFYKKDKTIDRTPSVILAAEHGSRKAINLDELYGNDGGLREWISNNAIPLVGKLTPLNFKLYEKIAKPMLMMFLDLTYEDRSSSPGRIVGGKSGGIFNEALLAEFREVAQEHSDRIAFVYLDGTKHEDQMRSLGLFGGKERLPSIAFNTRDNLQIPFPEEMPINKDTLLQYCADFLSGKLKSKKDAEEMAKKALQSARPINQKNKAQRKARKQAPEQVKGVSEQYDDGSPGDKAVLKVTLKNFEEVVMNEDKDVVLMLHTKGCEPCSHLAVYYKHIATKFKDMNIPSLVLARMDITDESPPPRLNILPSNAALPILMIFPAGPRTPPWTYYSGVGKAQQIMKWIHAQAGIPFELPNLPHLTDAQRVEYKKQVREREEALEKERKDMERAMKREELAQKEAKIKRRQRDKRVKEEEEAAARATAAGGNGDSSAGSAGKISGSAEVDWEDDEEYQAQLEAELRDKKSASRKKTQSNDQDQAQQGGGGGGGGGGGVRRKRGGNSFESSGNEDGGDQHDEF